MDSGEHADTPLILDGGALGFGDVEAVARRGRRITVDAAVLSRLDAIRKEVDRRAGGREAVYGLNTGFGSLARVRIEPDEVRAVQRNLIRSHAAGIGEPLPTDIVRAMMLILAASLARGRSGVRSELLHGIVELLNRDITPIVPSRGSVGASGDLAPLAHAVLVLIGEGHAAVGDASGASRRVPGAEALAAAELQPITLEAKEGLALINGTHLMTARGVLMLRDIDRLFDAALAAAAMAVDACRGSDEPLDPRIHLARNQPGQRHVAERMRSLLAGSQIIPAHKEHDPRVQDPYCLRAAPQVLGAVIDTIEFVRDVFTRELGAITDNPLVFEGEQGGMQLDFLSGGNFHGMPLAVALDTLSIALCHLAGIAERRVNWLLTASDSENPVNPYLSPQPGLHSGLMLAQYTAAACCNELQTLAAPASVGNIPTSAGVEDYNSMGVTAGHQAMHAVDLATHVVAVELLVMAEALEYQRPLSSGAGVERTHSIVRERIPRLTEDRPPGPDIAAIVEMIRADRFD